MFLLNKIFHLREKLQIGKDDEEKPFLHHLDELRSMLMKMIITVLVTTVLSFIYGPELMSIIRYPADQVWTIYEEKHLPSSDVSYEEWGEAKALAYSLPGLGTKGVQAALKHVSPREKMLVEAVYVLRTARVLDLDKREEFVREASSTKEVADLVSELEKSEAILTDAEGKGSLLSMSAFNPPEPFMLSMKLAFYAGLVLSSPLLIFYLLQFIIPGLLTNERKVLYRSMLYGFGLFLTGILFAYFIVLPRVLTFFYEYALEFGIMNEWRIGYYVSFATRLILMFGLAFELPIIVFPFIRLGVLTYELMNSTRRYAIVGVAVLAAVITPTPDAFTMMLMAVPMYALYELCILLAWREGRRKRQREEQEKLQADKAYGFVDGEGSE